jgi:sodium/proline symporter
MIAPGRSRPDLVDAVRGRVLATLVAYQVVLLGIGLVAARRTRSDGDFLLGGRRLGPLVAAISASASSSPVWTLVGASGFAYAKGLVALWLLPACVGRFALNWYVLAPRSAARPAHVPRPLHRSICAARSCG